MRLVVKDKSKFRINRIVEWLIYMVVYFLIFSFVASLFKSVYIDDSHYYIYSIIIVLIIYILNITVKPIFVTLTIPITGMTLGLFYPFINYFILKLTDWILGPHFQIKRFWIGVLMALMISFMNLVIDKVIVDPIIRRVKDGQNSSKHR